MHRVGERTMSASRPGDWCNRRSCPFYSADREERCDAVAGSMRCSLFEIENYCCSEGHTACPVYLERLRTREPVPVELYEARLVTFEFQQLTV